MMSTIASSFASSFAENITTLRRKQPVPLDRFRKSIFTIGVRCHELPALFTRHGIDRISTATFVPQLRNVLANNVSRPVTTAADRVLLVAGTIVVAIPHARRTNVSGSRVIRASHQRGARSRLIDGPFAARRGFLRLEMRIRQKRVNKSPSIRPT